MQKPKLLFFINTLNFGGAERVVSQLLLHLNDSYELHLALYDNLIKYEIPKEVKILSFDEEIHGSSSSSLLRLPILAKKLNRYCKKERIPICIGFLSRPCYILAIMRRLLGYRGKIILCERSHRSSMINFIGSGSAFSKKIAYWLTKYSYNQAHLVIANAEVSKADLIKNFAVTKPIKVIYNPIDINTSLQKASEPLGEPLNSNYFYYISTGNFRPEKNFGLLIQAFSLIKKANAKLILVGGGALQEELKDLVHQLGLGDRVIFTGFQSNPYKYISKSNCFVLSSYTEGFPNVLLEALACGKAIISTDCKSGPRELLAPPTPIAQVATQNYELASYGILTPVNDAQALAAAMIRMYEDQDLLKKYEEKSVARAEAFDIGVIKKQFTDAFSL